MMTNPFTDLVDRFFGRNCYGVTKPSMDGALRPNSMLDEAAVLLAGDEADNVVCHDGSVLCTVGREVRRLGPDGQVDTVHQLPAVATAMAVSPAGRLAVALAGGFIMVFDKGHPTTLRAPVDYGLKCLTALAFLSDDELVLANGSSRHAPSAWQADLMERNRTGSVWRLSVLNDKMQRLAGGLGYPCGLLPDGDAVVVAEAWSHRLVRMSLASKACEPVLVDLPGYPGRMVRDAQGAPWLCLFAPRSQLIEFVLREPLYCREMMRTIPRDYWIAPAYRSGDSFHEPLQGGSVKQMGILKPWAPTRSYGLVVKLDAQFQPVASFHSRADGKRHGVTSITPHGTGMVVSSRGGRALLALQD